ncbi:hypothetical protein L5515_003372 [Caenorhabditis briggsae]|uniref:Uncharacterized protein n=1 Tax=Caenorhabditis briggsae TaxID=6238 RepID=A0AAE9EIC6_CAEBR|nr:hypothetical protein L5515_003372 [Caenorhabditis briggsae]
MDSGSDVEPPPKVSKTEILTPSRAQKLKELHLSILAQYGINSEFEVSRPMDVVNNEVVCSLMALNVSKMDVFRITKSLLGLDGNEQCELVAVKRELVDNALASQLKRSCLSVSALASQLKLRKFVIKQSAPSSSFTVSTNSKPHSVDKLVKKLEGLIGSHQYARQLLLNDDDRIGKKFFNASSGKHAFVIDFRISKGKTTAAVQYEGERKPIHIDFDHFQKSIDDGTFQFS